MSAKNRLKKITEHFYENKDLFYEYNSIIEYQKERKNFEMTPDNNSKGKCYYLPHYFVIRPEKLTTKMKMVLDVSSKSVGKKSLNECLYPSPSLTAELYGVLLRFRVFNVAVIGDIEKVFLQISLNSGGRYGFWMCIKLIFQSLKLTSLWLIRFVLYYLRLHHYHFCYPTLSYPISLNFTI